RTTDKASSTATPVEWSPSTIWHAPAAPPIPWAGPLAEAGVNGMMPRAMHDGVTAPPATPCATWMARVPASTNPRAIPPVVSIRSANGDVSPFVSGSLSSRLPPVAPVANGVLTRTSVTLPREAAQSRMRTPRSTGGSLIDQADGDEDPPGVYSAGTGVPGKYFA